MKKALSLLCILLADCPTMIGSMTGSDAGAFAAPGATCVVINPGGTAARLPVT